MTRILFALLTAGFFALTSHPAHAAPQMWEINFQDAASLSAEEQHKFHHFVLIIITAITVFVMGLLFWVIVRYNKWANPVPSQTSHNVLIEIIWTIIPVLILIAIAVPSFRLLYFTDRTPNPEMTLEVRGFQWYWGYTYPDNGGVNFTSYMIPEKEIDIAKGQIRLLSTDNPIVLPVDTNIQILTTAEDVIHAFAVPALGVKIDAMPGHTNETWVRITKPGVYYGQCSELCGKDHAYMPIEVHAVPKEEFNAWIEKMKAGDSQ
jgi:cytochrome c oxidase subunit 2